MSKSNACLYLKMFLPLALLITGLICYCYGVGMAGPLIASGCVTTCAVATNAWKKWHEGEENPSLKTQVSDQEARLSDLEARLPKQGDDRRPAAPSRPWRITPHRRNVPDRNVRRRLFAPQRPVIESMTDVQATAVQTAEN